MARCLGNRNDAVYEIDTSALKVTVLSLNNFVGTKLYCLKVAFYVYLALNGLQSFLRGVYKTVNWLVVGYHSIF